MTSFERKLGARIHEELARQRLLLEAGAIRTIEDYRYIVGKVSALKLVVEEYFDDVNSELNREE